MSEEEGDVQTDNSVGFLLASQAAGYCCMGFPGSSVINCVQPGRRGRPGCDPWVGRSPWGGNGPTLLYFYLGNPLDRGTWWATVHGVAGSQT